MFTFLATDLLRGAPEFILQPVVMARFLDKSWQRRVVDS